MRRPSRRSAPRRPTGPRVGPALLLGLALLLGVLGLVVVSAGSPAPALPAPPPAPLLTGVTDCRGYPAFTRDQGFTGGVIIDTSLPERSGLVLADPDQPGRAFQHPSWTRAGDLGPFAVDRDGHIYVAPVPRINVAANPPAGANTIWRVDSATIEMTPFLTLPPAVEPTERNPFGLLGLAYDCETHSLYAASVAGSGPTSERGRLFQVDLATGTVVSQIDGIDGFGLLVAHTPDGKYLLLGSAREGIVLTVALDPATGALMGDPILAFDLADLGAEPQERVRRLDLGVSDDTVGLVDLTVVPFAYSLAPKPDRHLTARFDGTGWSRPVP